MKAAIEKRICRLERASGHCPHCEALDAMSDKELDELLAFLDGKTALLSPELNAKFPGGLLPASSPTCSRCPKVAAMSEEELDAELARLNEILQDVIRHERGKTISKSDGARGQAARCG